jgi:c-di-GMP-binding flagellar brake protein YcgR
LVNQAQFYQQYTLKKVEYKLRVVNQSIGGMGTRLPTGASQPVAGCL